MASVASAPLTAMPSWWEPGSVSFAMLSGVPAAFVALTIGSIAAYIAYQQWKVARARLDLDLFEQRYALFELLWAFVSANAADAEDAEHAARALKRALPKFYFLFGPEIGIYVEEVLAKGIPQQEPAKPLSKRPAPTLNDADDVRGRFGRYLDFKEWA